MLDERRRNRSVSVGIAGRGLSAPRRGDGCCEQAGVKDESVHRRVRFKVGCHAVSGMAADELAHIHILKIGTGPFSFFHWIFIHPESHTESEISEIITHEETHARQYHSADVLVSEIMCTFCWFNPFVWLMKREVRGNLEYMADHRVLETGHDSKSYQYH